MVLRLAVNLITVTVTTLLAALLLAQPVFAQGVLGIGDIGGKPETEQGFLDEIVSQAEQRGVSVIVINPGADTQAVGDNDTGERSAMDVTALMRIQSETLKFRQTMKERVKSLPVSFPAMLNSLRKNSPSGDLHPYFKVLYWSALLLLVGAFVEHQVYVRHVINKWLAPRIKPEPEGYTEKLPVLVSRALLKIGGVFLSMLVAYMIGSAIFPGTPPETIQFSIALVYAAYAASRIVAIVWRVILAPYLSQYRIPHLGNADALRLFHWLWISATINIVLFMFSVWIGTLGSSSEVDGVLASVFGFVIAMFNTALVLVNRHAISRAMRGGRTPAQSGTLVRILSKVWVPLSITYFVFSWLEMTYRLVIGIQLTAPLIAGAYAILISVLVVYGLVNYVIERAFRKERTVALLNAGLEQADTAEAPEQPVTDPQPQSLNNYEDLARRVAGVLALLAGLWALTRIWKVEGAIPYSEFFTGSGDVITILFIGYIVYHIVRIWIDGKIQEEGANMPALAPGDEGGASGTSRLATLLPLFRNFMLVVVAVSVLFSALLEMGINVSPLFAGAGVVGLAIGFGAQTLVRDIFSGAFYLFDDAFRKGEYVDIGNVKGTVENISVRSFQLRHHLGPLHTIPFGEIQYLTNYSRDWVMMKLPLRLTYDTDPEKVRKLIKKLGLQLMDDPEIGSTFLQPLKSQGVIEMQDSAMIVRVKFMAKPGDQWVIRKRVFQEIRNLFEREGIKFAHREVTVRLAGEPATDLTPEQKQSVAAAALGDDMEDADKGDTGDDR